MNIQFTNPEDAFKFSPGQFMAFPNYGRLRRAWLWFVALFKPNRGFVITYVDYKNGSIEVSTVK